jgi:hypothetical protein
MAKFENISDAPGYLNVSISFSFNTITISTAVFREFHKSNLSLLKDTQN